MSIVNKIVDLRGRNPHRPSIRDLSANTNLIGQPHFNAMRSQDTVVASSRRVVMTWGMLGAQEMRIGNVDPIAFFGQTLPDRTTWVTAAQTKVVLTPGCFLAAEILYLPSGPTQVFSEIDLHSEFDHYHSDGGYGAVRVAATFYSQSASGSQGPVYFSRGLVTSALADNALPTDPGSAWGQLQRVAFGSIQPIGLDSETTLELYSEHCTVELAIEVQGSPRIVSLVLYETPYQHAQASSLTGPQSVHAFTAGSGLPTRLPQTKAKDGPLIPEPRYGTRQTVRVEGQQSAYLGPVVMQWDCYREDPDLAVDVREGVFVNSSTLALLHTGAQTGWAVPGVYAQRTTHCEEDLILRGRAAVIPVRIHVYASTTDLAPEARIRVQASERSYIDVVLTSEDEPGWHTATGYLESPAAYDSSMGDLQLWAQAPDDGSITVYSVSVQFLAPAPELISV